MVEGLVTLQLHVSIEISHFTISQCWNTHHWTPYTIPIPSRSNRPWIRSALVDTHQQRLDESRRKRSHWMLAVGNRQSIQKRRKRMSEHTKHTHTNVNSRRVHLLAWARGATPWIRIFSIWIGWIRYLIGASPWLHILELLFEHRGPRASWSSLAKNCNRCVLEAQARREASPVDLLHAPPPNKMIVRESFENYGSRMYLESTCWGFSKI